MQVAPGYISATELYRLPEAKRRLGMGRHSFTALRRSGLEVLHVGKYCYVRGTDIIRAIEQAAGQGGQEDG